MTGAPSLTNDAVGAVIVTFHPGAGLEENVAAIASQVAHVVIVDNGSPDDTRRRLRQLEAGHAGALTIVGNDRNEGLARALNQGVQSCLARGYGWVLTLDQDSTAQPSMVAELLAACRTWSGSEPLGIAAAGSVDAEGRPFAPVLFRADAATSAAMPAEVDLVHTSGTLLRAELVRTLGFFREDFFIDQVDYEFCFRLKAAGYRIVVVPSARLVHTLGVRTVAKFFGRRVVCTNHSALRRYYIARNRLVLFRETRNLRFIAGQTQAAVKELVKVALFESDKLPKFLMTLRGVWDGLRGRMGTYTP